MARNYSADATDAGDCDYAEEGFDCEGNCVAGEDRNGVCGGSAVIDECGVCGGSGIAEGECDCDGNVLDALGVCGGLVKRTTTAMGCATPTKCQVVWTSTTHFTTRMRTWTMDCQVGGCTLNPLSTMTRRLNSRIGILRLRKLRGCGDTMACNFDADAQIADDTLCTYPPAFVDCDGACLNDADGDGVCDELEVLGCTDPLNPGYNQNATEDDGSCFVGGCWTSRATTTQTQILSTCRRAYSTNVWMHGCNSVQL